MSVTPTTTSTAIDRTAERRMEVEVVDAYGAIANVTVRSAVYREYLQLAHTRGGWKIVNALWQRI
jgi:hypothetical protein